MQEVFTEENKNYYLKKAKTPGKTGSFSDEEVIKIRIEHLESTPLELYNKYGKEKISFRGFEAMLRGQNYRHIPLGKELKNNSSE